MSEKASGKGKKRSRKRKPLDPRHDQGIALVKEGKYAEAVPLFKSLLQDKPSLRDAWYGLGYCYYKDGNLEQSRLLMERAKGLGHPSADRMLRRIVERFNEPGQEQEVWDEPAPSPGEPPLDEDAAPDLDEAPTAEELPPPVEVSRDPAVPPPLPDVVPDDAALPPPLPPVAAETAPDDRPPPPPLPEEAGPDYGIPPVPSTPLPTPKPDE
ncbi:MAG: tetratricopeptide repeat protein [bacterium]|nr:tetratricopeptide repeat protein [bacterium]